MARRRQYSEVVPAAAAEVEHELFEQPASERASDAALVTDSDHRRPLFRHHFWHLVPVLTRQQLRGRFAQSRLNLTWNVVQPVALTAVYAAFFSGVLDVGSGSTPYLSFIIAGLVPWRFLANGLSSSTALSDNIGLISKIYFPREIIPIVNVVGGGVDLAIGTVLILVVAWAQGTAPSYHVIALPFVYLVLVLFTAAATIIVTTVAVFVRDVSHGMQLLLLGLFFATPIMYPESQLPSWLEWFPKLNPLAVVVNQAREVLLFNSWPNPLLLGAHLIAAGGLLVASVAYVRSVEQRMVDLA